MGSWSYLGSWVEVIISLLSSVEYIRSHMQHPKYCSAFHRSRLCNPWVGRRGREQCTSTLIRRNCPPSLTSPPALEGGNGGNVARRHFLKQLLYFSSFLSEQSLNHFCNSSVKIIQLGNGLVNQNLFLPLPAAAAAAILACGLVLDLSLALGTAAISGCVFGGSLTLEI